MTAFSLELKNVHKRFDKLDTVRDVSLQVHEGERCAVIGPNGAGKSTLFNLISGRFPLSGGDVLLHGQSIKGLKPFEIHRKGLARSFQITNLFPNLSVYENLRCALLWSNGHGYSFWHRLNGLKDVRKKAESVMEKIGLTHRRNVAVDSLAYAEQRALEIGVAIASDPEVILLDEPTAGMSRSESDAAVELIRKVTAGKTLLMVEHDMNVVFGLADRIAVLVRGEILACDTPEKIRADRRVQEAYLGTHAPSGNAI